MSSQVKVGLTVILAIVLFYVGLAWVNGTGFWEEDRRTFTVAFEEVDGLIEGDPVDVRGYVSGRVESIQPGANAVFVKIAVDEEIQLPENSTAEIRVKEILGGKQIAILPGRSAQLLQAGDTIKGKSSLDFSSAFSTVGRVVEDIDGAMIKSFLERFDTLTVQIGKLITAVDPNKVEQITDNLLVTTDDLKFSLTDVRNRNMIERLDTALTRFSLLAQTANGSLDQINRLTGTLEQSTLPKADSTLERIYALLGHTDEVLSTATKLLDDVQNPNSAIGYLLNDPEGGPLLQNSLLNLNRTLDYIRTRKLHVAMSLSHKKRTFEE